MLGLFGYLVCGMMCVRYLVRMNGGNMEGFEFDGGSYATDDFEFPDSLQPGELAGVIPESGEVLLQRVRDLCSYLCGSMPSVYGVKIDSVELGKEKIALSTLETIAFELNDEFTYSDMHKHQMMTYISSVVTSLVDEACSDVVIAYLEEEDADEEDDILVDIRWSDIIPIIDIPVAKIARAHVLAILNYSEVGGADWGFISETLSNEVAELIPNYWGYVGMFMIGAFSRVVNEKCIPTIALVN